MIFTLIFVVLTALILFRVWILLSIRPKSYAFSPVLHLAIFNAIYVGIGGALTKFAANTAFNLRLDLSAIYWTQFQYTLVLIATISALFLPKKYLVGHGSVELRHGIAFNFFMNVFVILVVILVLTLLPQIPNTVLLMDRVSAHESYLKTFEVYRLNTILYLLLTVYILGCYKHQNILFFVLLCLALVPLLYGSRNLFFAVLWVRLFFTVKEKQKLNYRIFFSPVFLFLLFLSGMWFFLKFPGMNLGATTLAYKFFAEAANTTIASIVVLQDNVQPSEIVSIKHLFLGMLPLFKFLKDDYYFAHYINEYFINAPYSLSANYLAEFNYYFGYFGIIFMLTYFIILFYIFRLKHAYFIILSASMVGLMRVAIRGSFVEALSSASVYSVLVYILLMPFGIIIKRGVYDTYRR